jgi:hypothetical protein
MVTSNARDQRRRAVGAPLADRNLWEPLAQVASGVTTSAERCIALLGGIAFGQQLIKLLPLRWEKAVEPFR